MKAPPPTALALLPLLIGCATVAKADEASEAAATAVEASDPAQPPPTEQTQPADQPQPQPAAAPSKKKWEFATIGYIFFAGAFGKSTPRDPLPPIDIHLPFGTVLKSFKFGVMGAAEARHDRLVFLGDLMWVHLGGSQGLKVRDVNFADVHVDTKTGAITALGGYRVVDNGPVVVDLLAGGRLNTNKQRVDYHGILLDLSASVSKTWIDPVVATRIRAPLGGKFGMSLYGDIGGFGIGSKLTWQGIATVNYQINHKMTVGAGWRYFQINYHDHDGFIYDVHQTGPIISLRTVF
jgi:opacity protein-like surface antigen